MRAELAALGLRLRLEFGPDEDEDDTDPGDCTSTPIGFTPSPGDQRWEAGLEP